jgi:pSer/pThr/pTyr-binding forkhead associated (FHA) protein
MNRQDGTKTIYIGRDAKNDIVIDNSSISRSHAMISLVGGEYRLKDNNSLNGVFVNGRKVEFEIIGPQDRITIGTEYMLDWSRIEKAFRSKAAEASQADLSGPSISIGRDPDNDVVVNNAAVSRKHAKIYVNEVTGSGTRYYIKDLGSRNGLFVNGEKITSRQISPNDNITLGSICHLNWQDIQAAQRRKFRPAPPPPPPPPPPTIISEPTPKKR